MKEIRYVITDPLGVHARPAGLLVKKASSYESAINISKGDKSVDAKRIFGVMGMSIKQGDEITLHIAGADEEVAAKEMEVFMKETL